jgi:hypothetical protein
MPEAQEQGARWRAGLPAALGLQFDGGLLTAAARRAGGELGRDGATARLLVEQERSMDFAKWTYDHSSSKVQSGCARPMIEDAAIGPK